MRSCFDIKLLFSVIRFRMTRSLADEQVVENNEVTLWVDVAKKASSVIWFRGGDEVQSNESFIIGVSRGGLRHSLTIRRVTANEEGEYSVHIDNGNERLITSKCNVKIKGAYNVIQ